MDNREKEIFVTGHKNPDTDSICSALAYAYLKNQLKDGYCYKPCCAGQVSSETAYVLEYFKVKAPSYINDVRLQVQDAVINRGEQVRGNLSVKKGWELLRQMNIENRGVSTLAVVDSKHHLEGIITVGDIARSFMDVYGSTILAEAHTPYSNIKETLNAELLAGDICGEVTEGKVLIAAANPDLMESYIESKDIVIMTDRYEAQLCAIEMNAACLIICADGDVNPSIIALAKEKGCRIMRTSFDTFLTARLLNQSVPVAYFMIRDELVKFKRNDYIDDIRGIMSEKRQRDFSVINDEGQFIGMISRHSLIDMDKKKVILVDHNESMQAIDGLKDAEIMEIIDHHKIGYIETMKPVYVRNLPVGCTATIIFTMFKENNMEIPSDIAGLMCSAILSDTLMYRSPTCTPLDRYAAQELAGIAGIEVESYAKAMFTAGSNLSAKTEEEIFYQDYKRFTAKELRFGVGQITSMDNTELEGIVDRMLEYMEKKRIETGTDMLFFMLTDILGESTQLLCVGIRAAEIAQSCFKQTAGDRRIYLPGVVSRKKQLIPPLLELLQ